MYKFILLTKHTDEELTLILQNLENKGLRLCRVKGNFFEFKHHTGPSATVKAYSFYAKGHANSTSVQMSEECVYLRESGWDTLCTSGPETLSDSRRHIFLIKEDKNACYLTSDKTKEKKVKISARLRAVSSLVLCLLFLASYSFMLCHDLIKIVTDNLYLAVSIISLPILIIASILCFMATVEQFEKKPKNLRILDYSSIFVTVFLILLALFLFADSVWHSKRGRTEKVRVGTSSFVLYNDEIPISLEDLDADVSGCYRTKRFEKSIGLLGTYVHFFDESFGASSKDAYDNAQVNRVSYISFSSFSSKNPKVFNAVCHQLKRQNGKNLIVDNNTAYIIKAGFPLSESQLNFLKHSI